MPTESFQVLHDLKVPFNNVYQVRHTSALVNKLVIVSAEYEYFFHVGKFIRPSLAHTAVVEKYRSYYCYATYI
jgi:hypothetical protein